MNVFTALLVAQLAASPHQVPPVLAFPEPGLDDPIAYQGYRTRLVRDPAGNAVQIYIDSAAGRVVTLWANASNESAGFTVRDTAGRPTALSWGGATLRTWKSGQERVVQYDLVAGAAAIQVGLFVLGSMRVERDFQYQRRHLEPVTAPPFRLPELDTLLAHLSRLDHEERQRHLAVLGAQGLGELQRRIEPTMRCAHGHPWECTVRKVSFDGKERLTLAFSGDPARVVPAVSAHALVLRSPAEAPVRFTVTVGTTARALTPLSREQIFNDAFRAFYEEVRADSARDPLRFRRLERRVRGTELLSYREKLMAGLPNFATYFGRDMLMAALMMEPIWRAEMAEHVIAAVLEKLSPTGEVSHEEALGGQAIRENAAQYNRLLEAYWRTRAPDRTSPGQADSLLQEARAVLADLRAVRENYRMVDDDFQFPVLVARYLRAPDVPAARKRSFLLNRPSSGSATPNLELLLRNLAYVADRAAPYAREPAAQRLVDFPPFEDGSGWFPGSWRDSRAGYASGRFAMDVNAAWVPHALDAIETILAELERLGWTNSTLAERVPGAQGAALRSYFLEPQVLRAALALWHGARRHFEVDVTAEEVKARLARWLDHLPGSERGFWRAWTDTLAVAPDGLRFLALSLDSAAQPIPVINTDPATLWFLEDVTGEVLRGHRPAHTVIAELETLLRPYPVGLFVPGLGALVANDVFAAPEVQRAFRADPYHSPRVVWGREVNLLLLALTRQIAAAYDSAGQLKHPDLADYTATLVRALAQTLAAVGASGLKDNELWSYRIEGGRLEPVRYGTSSDVQLWNMTDLAVQYALARLPEAAAALLRDRQPEPSP